MSQSTQAPQKSTPKKAKDPKAAALRASLNLPQTDFPMRGGLVKREPEFQAHWQRLNLDQTLANRSLEESPAGPYVFHDGPPYANGDIHMGHMLNKVFKDIVVRSRLQMGHQVRFVPGWDCHGLPIEHAVSKKLGKKMREMSKLDIREACSAYADKFIDLQRGQMRRLGTTGLYDTPYLTKNPNFESGAYEVLEKLVEEGLVYRDLKPVHWSIANRTALAEAELEYQDKEDLSVFVLFELESGTLPSALNLPAGSNPTFCIWTTTPWSLPGNRAIAIGPHIEYGLYETEHEGLQKHIVLATALAEKVLVQAGIADYTCLGTALGQDLIEASLRYRHPFSGHIGPVVSADYVTTEDGTGLVHTAPGHGTEDYLTGLREHIEIYCPVQDNGTYDDTVVDWLQGLSVWKANPIIAEHLQNNGHLLHKNIFTHSYPHDWRSKTPTIYRATDQWFIAVDKPLSSTGKTLREMALVSLEGDIEFTPAWGKPRLEGMLQARPDWCISRQRSWGLPIPAFLSEGKEPLLTAASITHIRQHVAEHGSNIWFEKTASELLEGYDMHADPHAPAWLKEKGPAGLAGLEKSADTFDVWFESGSSWNAVLKQRGIGFPSEIYLEGSDQHRGWFQVSLLTSLGAEQTPAFKRLLTHGFVVDGKGRKMSKSLGNVIGVKELVEKYGADICRWWVCSQNYAHDMKADWNIFKVISEEYRKIRNTIRFGLSSLFDFDPSKDMYTFTKADGESIDAWALGELEAFRSQVEQAYQDYNLRGVRDLVFTFCNETLSAIYFAALKDRLYCEVPDSPRRRRAQTALYQITQDLIQWISPVLVHTADEAYWHLQGQAQTPNASIHTQLFQSAKKPSFERSKSWNKALEARSLILKALEENRERIKNPLDAGIAFHHNENTIEGLKPFQKELEDLCGVSRLDWCISEKPSVEVLDLSAEPRCERSWRRDISVQQRENGLWLTDRDAEAMKTLAIAVPSEIN